MGKTETTATVKKVSRAKSISRTTAVEMMKESKGRFFTVVYKKKDGSERQMNCQYLKGQRKSSLGYVKVKEASLLRKDPENCIKSIDSRTVISLRMGGLTYKVK